MSSLSDRRKTILDRLPPAVRVALDNNDPNLSDILNRLSNDERGLVEEVIKDLSSLPTSEPVSDEADLRDCASP